MSDITRPDVTATSGGVAVAGNVAGSIHVNHRSVEVNTNYGTVINQADAPVVQLRDVVPLPPRAPLDFFDRTTELGQLDQLIAANKPISIYGHDGTGKSTLMRQASNSAAARALPHGVVLLEGVDESGTTLKLGDVIQRLFDALYQAEPPLKVNDAIARTYLSNTRPLVLLDNVQLESPDQYRTLIDLCPQSSMVFALPAGLPGQTRLIRLGPLPRADAIELFTTQSGVFVNDGNRAAVDAICALVGDVPLAIVRTADVIREADLSLDQARATLTAAAVTTTNPIDLGLQRAFKLAQSILSEDEQRALTTVANLRNITVDPGMVLSISGASQPALDRLKAFGLLHANSPRLRIDPAFRPLAGGHTAEGNQRWLKRLLDDVADGRTQEDEYCAAELANFADAIDWATHQHHQHYAAAITLVRAIDPYLTLHGLWDLWAQLLNQALAAARANTDRSTEAWALHQLGTRAAERDAHGAATFYREALAIRRALGEIEAAAYTQHNLDVLFPPLPPARSAPQPPRPLPATGLLSRLLVALIVLGAIVAGVLLTGGIFVGPQSCDRMVGTSPRAGRELAVQIERAKLIGPGDMQLLGFSEDMLNAYVHEFAAKQGILNDAQARLVEPGVVMLCGEAVSAGSVPVAARFRILLNTDQPYQLEGLAVRVLNTGGTFGWVAVPNALANQLRLMERVNEIMGNRYFVTGLDTRPDGWSIQIRGR